MSKDLMILEERFGWKYKKYSVLTLVNKIVYKTLLFGKNSYKSMRKCITGR
jgi:hypothetical protein